MVMRKIFIVIVLVVSVILTTSCWSRREIDQLGIVLGIGVSKTDEGRYTVVAQVANPSAIVADAPDQRDIYTLLKAEGLTVFDALRNLSMIATRRLFLGHVSVVLVDETIAREGISEIASFFLQDMEARMESEFLISKLSPEKIFDTPNTIGQVPAKVLETIARNYGASSKIFVSDLHMTIEAANNPVINFVTSLVEKFPPPTEYEMDILKITQIAVFDDHRLKGYLDYEEGQGFNFITNNYINGLIVFQYKPNLDNITIEILHSEASITPKYSEGKVGFDIELKVKGNVAERMSKHIREEELDIELIQNQLDKVLEDKLLKTISAAQKKFEVDFFNLSGHFARKYPQQFKALKGDWNKAFSNADINVKVQSAIMHSALSTNRGRI